ncbi:MAG: hypothetical protein QNJ75_09785 [Acidimicrobiia bacterium]|nr:hypothetical protein [Acidimicrobiia bacterium]
MASGEMQGSASSKYLPIALVAMAALVVALGAWIAFGPTNEASMPGDVEALINDYLAAWEAEDGEALEALVTNDYLLKEVIYAAGRDIANPEKVSLTVNLDRRLVAIRNAFETESERVDWRIELSGTPIVIGDGAWVVSVEETWTDAPANSQLTGIATYVVMDDDGTLKIDKHYWAGMQDLLEMRFN